MEPPTKPRMNPMQLKRKRQRDRANRVKSASKLIRLNSPPTNLDRRTALSNICLSSVPSENNHVVDEQIPQDMGEPLNKENELPYPDAITNVDTNQTPTSSLWMSRIEQLYKIPSSMQKASTSGRHIPTTLETTQRLPIDWSLKTRVVITTNFSCQSLHRINRTGYSGPIWDFSNELTMSKEDVQRYGIDQCWDQARRQWQYISSNTVSGSVSGVQQWQLAFQSVYYGLRNATSPHLFYVVTPQFVAAFYNKGARRSVLYDFFLETSPELEVIEKTSQGGDEVCALLSRSTKSLRALLRESGIKYDVPFDQEVQANDVGDHAVYQELRAFEESSAATTKSARVAMPSVHQVHGPDSLLLFQGHEGVHGLYDLLLNQTLSSESTVQLQTTDQVEIHSTLPFELASLSTQFVQFTPEVQRGTTGEVSCKLELSGCILPSAWSNICTCLEALAEQQFDRSASFALSMETHPLSIRFNVPAIDYKGREATRGNSDDRQKKKQSTEVMQRYCNELKWSSQKGYSLNTRKTI